MSYIQTLLNIWPTSGCSYHYRNVLSPVTGQGAVQLQQSLLGPLETAEVVRVEGQDHGEMVHTTQRDKRLNEDVLIRPVFQDLLRKNKKDFYWVLPLIK